MHFVGLKKKKKKMFCGSSCLQKSFEVMALSALPR